MTAIYKIIKTPCWPCQWKVEGINLKPDNHWGRFHRTWGEAAEQIEKLGGTLSEDSDVD